MNIFPKINKQQKKFKIEINKVYIEKLVSVICVSIHVTTKW